MLLFIVMKKDVKGQSSFELLFVLSIIVVLSTIVITYGIDNLNEISALSYTHNSIDEYLVSGTGVVIDKIESTVYDDSINITIHCFGYNCQDMLTKIKQNIETNIKEKTKYTNVDINISSQGA